MPPFRIALSGKGGTGKTTTAALLIDAFRRMGEIPLLAVDADPNANLHEALGMEVTESPRRDARGGIHQGDPGRNVAPRLRPAPLPPGAGRGDGRGPDRDGPARGNGLLLFLERPPLRVPGRPPGGVPVHRDRRRGRDGAHQPRHDRDARPPADRLDPGCAGMRTATRIRDIALSLGLPKDRMFLVVNRVRAGAAEVGGEPVPLIAEVPADPAVEEADLEGRPIVTVPDDSPARTAVAALAEKILEMARAR